MTDNNILTVQSFFDSYADKWDDVNHYNFDVVHEVLDKIDLQNSKRCLDIGCGTGVITGLLYEKGCKEVVGIDLSSKMIENANKKAWNENISFTSGNVLEYNGGKFDRLVIFSAYPHFKDKKALAKKAFDLLEEGGTITILHCSSKEKINGCHHKLTADVSSKLLNVKEEFSSFEEYFTLIDSADNDEKYYIIMKKDSYR